MFFFYFSMFFTATTDKQQYCKLLENKPSTDFFLDSITFRCLKIYHLYTNDDNVSPIELLKVYKDKDHTSIVSISDYVYGKEIVYNTEKNFFKIYYSHDRRFKIVQQYILIICRGINGFVCEVYLVEPKENSGNVIYYRIEYLFTYQLTTDYNALFEDELNLY